MPLASDMSTENPTCHLLRDLRSWKNVFQSSGGAAGSRGARGLAVVLAVVLGAVDAFRHEATVGCCCDARRMRIEFGLLVAAVGELLMSFERAEKGDAGKVEYAHVELVVALLLRKRNGCRVQVLAAPERSIVEVVLTIILCWCLLMYPRLPLVSCLAEVV